MIQPGTYDGGSSPADDLGTLTDFVALDFTSVQGGGANTMDCAIAACNGTLGNATPSDGYGTPRSTVMGAAIGVRVMKYGRTTGQTNGKVYAINASVNVGYSSGTAGFVGEHPGEGNHPEAGAAPGQHLAAGKGVHLLSLL